MPFRAGFHGGAPAVADAPAIRYSGKPSAVPQASLRCRLIWQALWRLPAAQAALM